MPQNIIATPDEIAAFCRKHHIRRLAFFGSVLLASFLHDWVMEN